MDKKQDASELISKFYYPAWNSPMIWRDNFTLPPAIYVRETLATVCNIYYLNMIYYLSLRILSIVTPLLAAPLL